MTKRRRIPAIAAAVVSLPALGACSSTTEGHPEHTAWGHHTWPDGISIEVTTGQACTPGPNAYPGGTRLGALISIKVSNGGDHDYRLRDLVPSSPERGQGAARQLDDPGGPCDTPLLPDKQVPPRQEVTFISAYTVTDVSGGKVMLVLAPNRTAEPVTFSGTIPVTHGA